MATRYMDVVVTSGIATGHAADVEKIKTFRTSCGDTALAIASGITLDNVKDYVEDADLLMVATGINFKDDFYNIDPKKLKNLMDSIKSTGVKYEF